MIDPVTLPSPLFAAALAQLRERTQTFFQQEQISGKPLEFFQCHRIGRIVTTREPAFLLATCSVQSNEMLLA